ncbi:MAG: hypothetical protein J2P17_13330 [Mycobacterium sp.]|nr:hypothetical protein [Mycobacterium sp.]
MRARRSFLLWGALVVVLALTAFVVTVSRSSGSPSGQTSPNGTLHASNGPSATDDPGVVGTSRTPYAQSGKAPEPGATGGSKPLGKPAAPKIIAWIKDLGPLGGATGKREEAFGALADGACADALKPAAELFQPSRSLYEGAASACLAAFHGRADLWPGTERAFGAVSTQTSQLDCIDVVVYGVLRSLVSAHRQNPATTFVKATGVRAHRPVCPRISAVVPDHGPLAGGYPVRIVGEHLPRTAYIHFGDHILTVTSADGRTAVLTVPAGNPKDPGDVNERMMDVWVEGWPFEEINSTGFIYDAPAIGATPEASSE